MPISNNLTKTLVLIIHGGHSTGQRIDDGIATREIIKNHYSTNKGNSIWTEHLDKFLDKNRFDVLSPIFPNGQDFVYTPEPLKLNFVLILSQEIGIKS